MTPRAARSPDPDDEDALSEVSVGPLTPHNETVLLVDYDPTWPAIFATEQQRVLESLGDTAVAVEHVGSTAVPGLMAKPIIDIVLAVHDSADETSYVPALEDIGYTLRIREPDWYEHRVLTRQHPAVNLHVFTAGASEMTRMLRFRDHLRRHPADRERYAAAKQGLARRTWRYVNDYADAKDDVIAMIQDAMTPER